MNDAVQSKLRVTLNLIHAMSKALATSTQLDSDLAQDTCFYCSEMILRAAMELHQDIATAINDGKSGV